MNKLSVEDWAAFLLAALVVVLPLAAHSIKPLIDQYCHHGASNHPTPSDTIAVIGAVIVGAQALIAYRQLRASREQTRIADRQRELMDRQLNLTRKQHIATHRPRVIIRAAELVPVDETGRKPDRLVKATYLVANIGGSEAIICGSKITLRRYPNSQSELSIEPFSNITNHVLPLRAGESIPNTISDEATWGELTEIFEGRDQSHNIVFAGVVLYDDGIGIRRRTHFWRKLNLRSLHFVRGDDPEYEYTD